MRTIRAWSTLVWISFERLLWSANTWMVLAPLAGCFLYLLRRDYASGGYGERTFDHYSNFLIQVYASIVVPLCTLAFAAASIGGDREDRTLLFILVRPIARPLVLLAKVVATVPLALGIVVGSFYGFCRLAGEVGGLAYAAYLPAMVLVTLAYIALFHLFAVAFRHSTIIALLYSLLVEMLLGHAPGIIKRVAVNFYGRTLMFAAGRADGLEQPDPHWFEPLSPPVAAWALVGFALLALGIAIFIFQRREYRDLS